MANLVVFSEQSVVRYLLIERDHSINDQADKINIHSPIKQPFSEQIAFNRFRSLTIRSTCSKSANNNSTSLPIAKVRSSRDNR